MRVEEKTLVPYNTTARSTGKLLQTAVSHLEVNYGFGAFLNAEDVATVHPVVSRAYRATYDCRGLILQSIQPHMFALATLNVHDKIIRYTIRGSLHSYWICCANYIPLDLGDLKALLKGL